MSSLHCLRGVFLQSASLKLQRVALKRCICICLEERLPSESRDPRPREEPEAPSSGVKLESSVW